MKKKTRIMIGVSAVTAAAAAQGIMLYRAFHPKKEKGHADKKTIVCIGDSITYGAGVKKSRRKDAWPYLLNGMTDSNTEVLNYGISGATMLRKSDYPYRKSYYQAVEDIDPDELIVMLGTNDSKPQNWNAEEYEADYEAFLKRFLKEGRKIILMVPPKAFLLEGKKEIAYKIQDSVIREEVIPCIWKLSEKYSLPVIDLYRLTEEHPEYFDDGVHPNVLGNRSIAECVFRQL